MILMIEHYAPTDESRARELAATLEANKNCQAFQEIFVMQGPSRLTFGRAFRVAAEQYSGKVCVLANADIQFDASAHLIRAVVGEKVLVTLTRWETDASPRMVGQGKDERFYSGSQDAWAWIGGELVGVGEAIPLGYIGCDNAIAGEAMNAGYDVVNPSLSIKTRHNHASTGRGPDELSVTGTYAYPEMTTLFVTNRMAFHKWPLEQPDAADHA